MAENQLRTLFMDLAAAVRQHHDAGNGIHTDLLKRVDEFIKAQEVKAQLPEPPPPELPPQENSEQSEKASPESEEAAGENKEE